MDANNVNISSGREAENNEGGDGGARDRIAIRYLKNRIVALSSTAQRSTLGS